VRTLLGLLLFQVSIPFSFLYAPCEWWGLWNIICSDAPLWPILHSALLAQTWFLSFFSLFSPLLSALFNGVCQGFIIKSQLQFHCTRKILLVLYIGYGPQRGQFWVFSTTPISRLMLGPCSKNTGLVITSQFNTFSHFSWIFCASTWIGYLSHQSSKMTALNSLSLVAMGWVHTTHPFRMLYSHLWALGGSHSATTCTVLCSCNIYNTSQNTCHVLQRRTRRTWIPLMLAHILRTVGPVLTFAF